MDGYTPGTMFINPERIIGHLDVKKGMVAADFGAGAGFYTMPLARAVGEEGKVYAVDIQKQHLDLIKSKAQIEHLLNVEAVWADLEARAGSRLPDGTADLVLVSNILFQVAQKLEVMKEAARILKPGGRMAVIEWDETPFPGGPPGEMRIAKRTVQALAAEAGFAPDREFEAGTHHYGLLYRKP